MHNQARVSGAQAPAGAEVPTVQDRAAGRRTALEHHAAVGEDDGPARRLPCRGRQRDGACAAPARRAQRARAQALQVETQFAYLAARCPLPSARTHAAADAAAAAAATRTPLQGHCTGVAPMCSQARRAQAGGDAAAVGHSRGAPWMTTLLTDWSSSASASCVAPNTSRAGLLKSMPTNCARARSPAQHASSSAAASRHTPAGSAQPRRVRRIARACSPQEHTALPQGSLGAGQAVLRGPCASTAQTAAMRPARAGPSPPPRPINERQARDPPAAPPAPVIAVRRSVCDCPLQWQVLHASTGAHAQHLCPRYAPWTRAEGSIHSRGAALRQCLGCVCTTSQPLLGLLSELERELPGSPGRLTYNKRITRTLSSECSTFTV